MSNYTPKNDNDDLPTPIALNPNKVYSTFDLPPKGIDFSKVTGRYPKSIKILKKKQQKEEAENQLTENQDEVEIKNLFSSFTMNSWQPKPEEVMSKKMESNLRNYQEELSKIKILNKKTLKLGKSIKYHKKKIREIGVNVKRVRLRPNRKVSKASVIDKRNNKINKNQSRINHIPSENWSEEAYSIAHLQLRAI
ncbi:unnamed protein product [Moneuplotes crassus]|uniref:Uncharacterized protein n=1 Tax=Euplotes crassus TaxID=5936 RepID=A0AAD1UA42_EUPCR|nr:unnamed protein product [Moneuplotes crassus]